MRSFFGKFVIIIVPCLFAAYLTSIAYVKYQRGDSGGFHIGPDLAGGTNLVYEIDLPKMRTEGRADSGFDPVRDINVLAEALKRRIDPNDLYNIVIRPAGGEGRIEIVLPTGGTYRAQKAEAAWADLLKDLHQTYFPGNDKVKLDVPRGKTFELADQIQILRST